MILHLKRQYFPEGTNGELMEGETHLCFTIELPWKNNENNLSCIPEGKYQLVKKFSRERKWHLELINVPNRYGILIHAANYALKELKGCIAPVTFLEGPGKGTQSRKANDFVTAYVFEKLKKNIVYLEISHKYLHHEHKR